MLFFVCFAVGSLFSSWIEDGTADIDFELAWNVYNDSGGRIDVDSLIEIVKYNETSLTIDYNDTKMTGVFTVDSYYILYQSSTATEYSSSVCHDYSNDIFVSGENYFFENVVSFEWYYDNQTSRVESSKTISLEATTSPTNGECFIISNDGNSIELVSIFNFSCVDWETSDGDSDNLVYNFLNEKSLYFLKSNYDRVPFMTTRLSENIDTMTGVIVDSNTGAATCYDIVNITVNSLNIQNYSQIQEICNGTFQEAIVNGEDVAIAVEICYEILNDTQNDANESDAAITGAIQEGLIFVFLNTAENFSSYEDAAQLLSILARITHPVPPPNDYIYSNEMISSVLEFVDSALRYFVSIVDENTPFGTDVAQSVVGMFHFVIFCCEPLLNYYICCCFLIFDNCLVFGHRCFGKCCAIS